MDRGGKKAEKDLNKFIGSVELELKRKLTPEEALEVKSNALDWLENNLTFPLPSALEKLRYESIGFNISTIKQLWAKRTWGSWNRRTGQEWEFTQEGTTFMLNEEQPAYKARKRYTTERQLELLEQSKALADALNLAAEQGLNSWKDYHGSHTEPMYKVKDTFRVLKYDDKLGKLLPDLEIISRMK